MPLLALGSLPVRLKWMLVGLDSEACSKVTVPATLESPRTTATVIGEHVSKATPRAAARRTCFYHVGDERDSFSTVMTRYSCCDLGRTRARARASGSAEQMNSRKEEAFDYTTAATSRRTHISSSDVRRFHSMGGRHGHVHGPSLSTSLCLRIRRRVYDSGFYGSSRCHWLRS